MNSKTLINTAHSPLTAIVATDLNIATGTGLSVITGGTYHNGDTLFRENIADDPGRGTLLSEVEVQIKANTFLAFQDPPAVDRGVAITLQEILECIRNSVVPGLEPFFP